MSGPAPMAAAAAAHTFGCGQCGAELRVSGDVRSTVCPYCDAPSVVERPATAERPDPSLVVGFVIAKDRAQAAVKRWIGRKWWFARSGFRSASLDKTRGVYLPAYLYGATAHSQFTVEIGEKYKDSDDRSRTEWRRLTGNFSCYVTDRIVTASRGLSNHELEAVEPFDLRAIRRFTPAMLAGWIAEEPSLPQAQCLALAHEETHGFVGAKLKDFMPGDKHRKFHHKGIVENEHIDLIMLPLWVFAVKYDPERPAVHVCVNGQTGKVGGALPYSWIKITLAALAGVALTAAIVVPIYLKLLAQ